MIEIIWSIGILSMKARLGSLFTVHTDDLGVSHTFVSLNKSMSGRDLATTMIIPSCEPRLRGKHVIEAIPRFLRSVCYRIPSAPAFVAEKRFISLLDQFDAVYLF